MRPPRSFFRLAAGVSVLAIAYALSSELAGQLRHGSTLSPVWPASGVALSGLLIFGRSAWPGIFIGGFLGSTAEGISGWALVGVHVGQTLAPVVAVSLLRAFRFDDGMGRVRDVLQLVFLGGGASVINATVGTTVLVAAGVVPSDERVGFFFTWWITDAMGAVLITPLLITWRAASRPGIGAPRPRWAELIMALLTTAVVSPLVFRSDLPLIFLTFPLVLWPALRIGQVGVSAANVVVTGMAVWATLRAQGPFSQLPYTTSLIVLEAFNASIVTTSLLLGAAVATTKGLNDDNERLQAEIRAQLEEVRASRARIVQAAEAERRRIERNLHDGAQQRLTSVSCALGLAQAHLGADSRAELQGTLAHASRDLTAALSELRELARGIHPPVLVQGGIRAAVESLAEQSPVPVDVTVPARRYSAFLEATAYFVVCESLTNVAKHARATAAQVDIDEVDGRLIVQVVDDGVGGVDVKRGTGLTGLADRVAAVEGRLQIHSLPESGTRIRAELPCRGPDPSTSTGPFVTIAQGL
jgi:signal transduction histidine kinase